MEDVKQWRNELRARAMVELLSAAGYQTVYAPDQTAARRIVLDAIPKGSSITLGGSMTVESLGLLETFRSPDYRLFDRYAPGLTSEQDHELRRLGMVADYMVTGTNAVTRRGELINVDCSGNKTAGMIFGPKHVIVVTGVNKLVEDRAAAMRRLREIAPLNSRRIGHRVPCVLTGECCDEECSGPQRVCNFISIVQNGRKYPGRFLIVVLPEETGM